MKKLIIGSMFAWMVVSGDGHIQPARQDRPFYLDQSQCVSVAKGLGHGAVCVYVSVPNGLAVTPN